MHAYISVRHSNGKTLGGQKIQKWVIFEQVLCPLPVPCRPVRPVCRVIFRQATVLPAAPADSSCGPFSPWPYSDVPLTPPVPALATSPTGLRRSPRPEAVFATRSDTWWPGSESQVQPPPLTAYPLLVSSSPNRGLLGTADGGQM